MPEAQMECGQSSILHHACIFANDIDLSAAFYESAFGLSRFREWVEVDATSGQSFRGRGIILSAGPTPCIEIFPSEPDEPEQDFPLRGINHFCLLTTDCSTSYARAIFAGGRPHRITRNGVDWDGAPIEMSVQTWKGFVTIKIAYLKGPDGEVIELYQEL